ncbi:MAG: hypothetical protein AAGE05_08505 [Pseudomonadota bacterium]
MPKPFRVIAAGLSLALCVTGCSNGTPDRPEPGGDAMMQRPMLFVSPAGKPYRNVGAATPPLAQWFTDADGNGDGALRYDELRDDFAAAFAEFDRDGDGDIQGPEVIYYEQEIFPEITASNLPGRRGARSGRAGGGQGRGPSGGRPDGASQRGSGRRAGSRGATQRAGGAARFGLLPVYHPIMQADTDIDRRVTRDEFQAAADLRFGLLDEDGDGAVTLDQLTAMLMERRTQLRRR